MKPLRDVHEEQRVGLQRPHVLAEERERVAEMLEEPLMKHHVEGAVAKRHAKRVGAH